MKPIILEAVPHYWKQIRNSSSFLVGKLYSGMVHKICKRDVTAELVRRAESNGYKAIVLTVDAPRLGKREADIKNKLTKTKLVNLEGLLSVDINSDLGWLKTITNLPILIKGVLTAADGLELFLLIYVISFRSFLFCLARWPYYYMFQLFPESSVLYDDDNHEQLERQWKQEYLEIIVSNHRGRQLDYSPAPISVLEEEQFQLLLMVDFVGVLMSSRLWHLEQKL